MYFRYLLEQGVNVNLTDRHRYLAKTVLHYAAEEGLIESIKLLLHFGADMNIQDARGLLPVASALENNNLDVVKLFIEELGFDINNHQAQYGNRTLLHIALAAYVDHHNIKRQEIIRYLLSHPNIILHNEGYGRRLCRTGIASLILHGFYCGIDPLEANPEFEESSSIALDYIPNKTEELREYITILKSPTGLLSFLVRKSIRGQFEGRFVKSKILNLPLPDRVKSFLLYQDVPV